MEFGINITSEEELKQDLTKYTYLYFGTEFCERKIPSLDFAKKIFDYAIENNKVPVLLTPPLTNNGLKRYLKLIEELKEKEKKFEVTINDSGLLLELQDFGLKLNLGRLILKMKKGPEITSGALLESADNFKDSSLSNPLFMKFYQNQKIKQFETDLPPQGINLPDNQPVTMYLGNTVISLTRRCIYPGIDTEEYNYDIKECHYECKSCTILKNTKYYSQPIYVIGNAELIKNKIEVPIGYKNKINRIVIFHKLN